MTTILCFREKERERLEKERLEAALRDKRCPTCSQKVYPEQAVEFSDVIFHKTCVKVGPLSKFYLLTFFGEKIDLIGQKFNDTNVFDQGYIRGYCYVGHVIWGIFASNSIIEFDPNRDSIPIFGFLRHRLITH